jgi:chromatin remodeling complex protein RSC6
MFKNKMPRKAVRKTDSTKRKSHSPESKEPESLSTPPVCAVAEVLPESVQTSTQPSASETAPKEEKIRLVPTRESVEQEFDNLICFIDEEVAHLRDSAGKLKGIKFLRSINKRVKILRSHALRIAKQRKRAPRSNNQNSGFLKPVHISKDLAKFTGWNVNEPRSRVDVTRFICDYIKNHDLQNPEDRRQIQVERDSKLRKLLKMPENSEPLKYSSLQTYLKNHFVKD